ncbi:SRPBCC family protein [Neobacillus sp. YIM B06451]|uniref:SRPBCC family protein n=1 Tax=Neobacillus sp. YIM B06451 TaxID=3070994 RepID=UPI00292F6111|nr:SRPBCC family protein [Neobacillus sp. YIM B06451]
MKFEFSTDIPAPREFVWKVAQDPLLRHKWDVRISKYIVHGVQETGAEVTIYFRVLFLRPIGKAKFLKFQPPFQSILKIENVSPPLVPTGGGTWIMEDIPGGTRMVSRFHLDTHQVKNSPDWLIEFVVRRDTTRSLKKLKKLVLKLSEEEGGEK